MGAFEAIAQTMADLGLFKYFFPWLITLAISYGILDQYEVVSEDDTVNGVTALSIAFFVIGAAFTTLGAGVFLEFAAALAFGVFAIVGLVILMGTAGYDLEQLKENDAGLPLIAAMLIFGVAFFGTLINRTAFFDGLTPLFEGTASGSGEGILSQLLVLLFLLLVIIFVVNSAGED